MESSDLSKEINNLANKYLPLAVEILKEAVRIPADYVGTIDPECGLSNHEKPRVEYLREMIIKHKAVENEADVYFDDFGNLNWFAEDKNDGIPQDQKKVIFLDGHTDTVNALRPMWHERIGGGLDPYNGLVDESKVNEQKLRLELGFLPEKSEWKYLVWGRGTADQLAGVISQIISTKICLELKHLGSLKGCIIHAIGTVTEEDNDGGGPMYIMKDVLPKSPVHMIPDVVIHTEGTGDSRVGALGIYRGQRGRMQIEVEVIGRSCHGSMPWEGKNPLEAASYIISEAAERYERREGFLDDKFLCHGTRTASWSQIQTPSDCAVPEKFTFRFDRRMTVGESPAGCIADIESFKSVKTLREKGFVVNIRIPTYDKATWKGYALHNQQVYHTWQTPAEHNSIKAAVDAYRSVVSPHHDQNGYKLVPAEPRVERWIFSTDGVGYHLPSDQKTINVPKTKEWVDNGITVHPPMFGFGAGFEQNTHKIGECVDSRELKHAIALISKFPSSFYQQTHKN